MIVSPFASGIRACQVPNSPAATSTSGCAALNRGQPDHLIPVVRQEAPHRAGHRALRTPQSARSTVASSSGSLTGRGRPVPSAAPPRRPHRRSRCRRPRPSPRARAPRPRGPVDVERVPQLGRALTGGSSVADPQGEREPVRGRPGEHVAGAVPARRPPPGVPAADIPGVPPVQPERLQGLSLVRHADVGFAPALWTSRRTACRLLLDNLLLCEQVMQRLRVVSVQPGREPGAEFLRGEPLPTGRVPALLGAPPVAATPDVPAGKGWRRGRPASPLAVSRSAWAQFTAAAGTAPPRQGTLRGTSRV